MTQLFDTDGKLVGVTVIELGPCPVLQKKTQQTDGYEAYQIGFAERKAKRASKALTGHCQKASAAPAQVIREFRNDDGALEFEVGQKLTVAEFQAGQYVDVIGTTKGKGFQGVMRRHNFGGGNRSHGAAGFHRRPGAIGQRLTPGHVFKNMKMPGQMGHTKVTTQNLKVLQVREAENLLLVEGAVPGPETAVVVVRHAKKKARPAPKS